MSTSTIVARFKPNGILTDADTAKLSDPTATYGVRRADNSVLVVADDTDMDNLSTGTYSYTFTDPADNLTYEYYLEFVWGAETYHIQGTLEGGADSSENLYDLTDQIQPHVGVLDTLYLKQALRWVARDFCRQTHAWVEDLTTIASVADQEDYSLTSAYDAIVLSVKKVELEEVEWEFSMDEADTLTMIPAPSADDDDIDVKVALLPDEDCSGFHGWFIDRWGDAMSAGAIYWLKVMPGRPWTDYEGAGFWREQYMDGVAKAKGEAITQRHRGAPIVIGAGDYS